MFNDRLLTQCHSDHQKKFGGLKEDYFAVLYLAKRFGLSQEEALKWVTFGGFEYGIDAYYIDAAAGNLYLYQFKWSDSLVQMGKSIDRIIDKGMDAIFGNQPAETRRNEIINRLRADVRERQAEIRRVFFFFISKGALPNRGTNPVLDSRLEDLERVSAGKLRNFFKSEIEIIIRVNDDAAPPPQFRFPLQWTGNSNYQLETGENLNVGFASLVDLANMYEKMGLRLFQKNIRAGLSSDTAPNRALKTAFQDISLGRADPKAFVFKHNGVSIEVADFLELDDRAEITEPRILNGAQSIVTLHRLLFPTKGDRPDALEIEHLSQVRVLAKVISGASEQFVTDVTIANNKQNPVKPWNLRASDRYQIDLEQRFKEEVNLYYDRLQNSYVSRGESEWEDEGIQPGKVIEIEKLGLTLTAARGEVDKMSRMPEVWEAEGTYREIFDAKFVEDEYDIRRIVLAYKVQFYLRGLVGDIASRGERKYGFISRGRNLVWALTIQALLNDDKIGQLLEDYGTDLKVGPDLRERLTKIATVRLAPVLNQAISLSPYRDQLKAEKFSFLKSNAFFKLCRNIGADKFDWAFKKL
jgi:hypothetical protein